MTWLKIDDKFSLHRKVIAAGNEAVGAWVRMAAHAAAQESDGYLEEAAARMFASKKLLKILIDNGLLDLDEKRRGFQIHDFLEYNPSRAHIEERRQIEKAKKLAQRARVRECPQGTPQGTAVGTPQGNPDAPDPTRPGPSRPEELLSSQNHPIAQGGSKGGSRLRTRSEPPKSREEVEEEVRLACELHDVPMLSSTDVDRAIAECESPTATEFTKWIGKRNRLTAKVAT